MQQRSEGVTEVQDAAAMRAVTQRAYGSADVLDVTTIDRPVIAGDEVLIEVVAAGLDRGVWHLMAGQPYLIRIMGFGLTRPKNPVLGMDVAGHVVAIGQDVTRFAVGDEVFGIGRGTYAEFAAAKESTLVHKPAGVTFEQAAASAISGITALQALTTVGRVEPGQHVLVIGASGGVGSFAVQLATALGATVTGVARLKGAPVMATEVSSCRNGQTGLTRNAAPKGAAFVVEPMCLDPRIRALRISS